MPVEEADPRLLEGGLHVDARGTLGYLGGFDMRRIQRVHWIRAHQANAVRGWVGHRREHKYFTVLHGVVLLAVVRPDQWECPARDLQVQRYVLCASKPQVLHVPPGYATGNADLTGGGILVVFSSGKFEDSKADDFRFPVDYWSIIG